MVVISVSATDQILDQLCEKKLISWEISMKFDKNQQMLIIFAGSFSTALKS